MLDPKYAELSDKLLTLDDFLLTLAPDEETGQYKDLSEPERGLWESGIPDGTPKDQCYAALIKSIGDVWMEILKEINKVTGETVTGCGMGE